MSCSVCAGYSDHNCPCCGGSSARECPKCEGRGHTGFFAYEIDTGEYTEVTETAYYILPEDEETAKAKGQRYCQAELERCTKCWGDGEIYDDY